MQMKRLGLLGHLLGSEYSWDELLIHEVLAQPSKNYAVLAINFLMSQPQGGELFEADVAEHRLLQSHSETVVEAYFIFWQAGEKSC